MKHDKLLESAKRDPGRIYANPADVLRDRRLRDADRIEILKNWEQALREGDLLEDDERLARIVTAREEAERRLPDDAPD